MLLSKVEKGSPEYENIQSDKEQVLAIIQDLYFDTKHIRRVAPLCEQPEDATLERDLVSWIYW